jgi:hypothetical protein
MVGIHQAQSAAVQIAMIMTPLLPRFHPPVLRQHRRLHRPNVFTKTGKILIMT